MFLEFCILLTVAAYLFYRWATANNDFFKKRGIAYDKPTILVGSMKDSLLRRKSMYDMFVDIYNKHDGSVFGIFDQRQPVLLIRDPEMLKQITIKDFDHFVNRRDFFANSEEDLFGNSLFAMRDAKWRDMRSTLSPVFTGSKMRQMFQLINQVAEDTARHMKNEPNINTELGLELDMKDYCTRFTNDVIATTAFGLQVNSLKDKNNEFYLMGKKATTFTVWQNIKFFLYAHLRPLVKLLRLSLFDKAISNYFTRIVLDAMTYRHQHNIHRPDMINLLMEARGMIPSENSKPHNPTRKWNDTEIVAQCFLFFFAGFETSAVLICFTAHELMENPEIQARLYEEVEEACSVLDGKPLTYEVLQNMKYMDMVVSEVLRKWTPAIAVDRLCNKDIVLEGSNGERVEIKKGDIVMNVMGGMHRDPKYFENPMKFEPERFSEENKNRIEPFTYMPFGMGPRNCIGSRFALMEAKALIFYLVRDFQIKAAKKTCIPIELTKKTFQLQPKDGFWLKLIARDGTRH